MKTLLAGLLRPLSWVYALAVAIRNALYDAGWIQSKTFSSPVIGVGNISAGGSGKTPFCIHLIGKFRAEDKAVAYVSRGYGRTTRGVLVVSPETSTRHGGDEAVMVARRFPEVPVVVAENRVSGVEKALQMTGEGALIILDDAFQHRAVTPGLQVVLLSGRDIRFPRWLLPAGRLREPLSALRRADVVVWTKLQPPSPEVSKIHFHRRTLVLEGEVCITGFQAFPGGHVFERPEGDAFFVFCGIGHPEHFLNTLRPWGKICGKRMFADHHTYSENDFREIVTEFDMLPFQNKALVTTEKDWVKIRELDGWKSGLGNLILWVARSEFQFKDVHQEEQFYQKIHDTFRT